jgi:ribosomal protein S18 acetylase RimI-like enzyme
VAHPDLPSSPAGATPERLGTLAPSAGPQPAEVTVEEVTEASTAVVDALNRLLPQLSSTAPPLTAATVGAIVASPATTLLVARRGDEIVGSLTLALFRLPTGLRAWIEDVVVDEAARGAGVGAALTRAALARAEAEGARTVDLTSRPDRQVANRLYQRVGFERRNTNVYRYRLEAGGTM